MNFVYFFATIAGNRKKCLERPELHERDDGDASGDVVPGKRHPASRHQSEDTMNTRISIFVTVAVLATAAQASPYVSTDGYQITPPSGWTTNAKEAATHNVYFDSPDTAEIGVFASPVDAGETPSGDLPQLEATLKKQFLDFKVVSQRTGNLAGEPDLEMVATYTTKAKKLPLKLRQVITKHNGMMYGFSLTEMQRRYAQTAPLFDKSLRTVQWVGK
jgi:hypothetical protein